jgi:ABC-type transporter Mla MlaB component
MSVLLEQGALVLRGDCAVEDAEPMLALLQQNPGLAVDLTGAGRLHTAIVQLLLAFRPQLVGPAGDPFFDKWLLPQVRQ